ncbi:MAG: HAMP domain-containing sensor histidine kinase [Bacteroidales bacterium]
MSRTLLWIVTVFLSLTMLALVGLQAYWIKHSIESKQTQMGLVVNQVLADISNELEQNEAVLQILEELQSPLFRRQSRSVWNFRMDFRSSLNGMMREDIRLDGSTNTMAETVNDSVLVILDEERIQNDTIMVQAMNPDQIRAKLNKSLEEQQAFVDKIIRKMLAEEEDIEERISKSQIETLLRIKLTEKGVNMPFEYAVYEEGKPPIFQSGNFNEYEDCPYYRTALFPKRIFDRPTFISVYFPDERKNLVKSMGILGGTSLLITVFTLMLFSLALYIIFKQKKLSEMKNDFVNNMTHELKTPISTISLASQMLSDRTIPDEQKNLSHISRIIRTESRQLSTQVERVLQMAIFDHGQLKLKEQELDLHEIIETVAQNFLLQIEKRQGKLEFLPEAENSVITGDLVHMTNVVSNLLENAMKYTGRSPEITIATRNQEGAVLVSVRDNGIGISKENQKRIFDKFYRVPTGNVHNVKGFGLGLSYVKLIVEEHHGTIRIKSEPNKGSLFVIQLPLKE